jgi:hypothetical protein
MDQAHTSMLSDHSLIMGNELALTMRIFVRVCMPRTALFSLFYITALTKVLITGARVKELY